MSDGRLIGSVPINIPTENGPGGSYELAAPAQGEWIRTGNHEFASHRVCRSKQSSTVGLRTSLN